jgi:hypothetical protein
MKFEPFAELTKELQFVEKEDKKENDCRCLWHDQVRARACVCSRRSALCGAHASCAACLRARLPYEHAALALTRSRRTLSMCCAGIAQSEVRCCA